jgi:hypothetical protein
VSLPRPRSKRYRGLRWERMRGRCGFGCVTLTPLWNRLTHQNPQMPLIRPNPTDAWLFRRFFTFSVRIRCFGIEHRTAKAKNSPGIAERAIVIPFRPGSRQDRYKMYNCSNFVQLQWTSAILRTRQSMGSGHRSIPKPESVRRYSVIGIMIWRRKCCKNEQAYP